MRSRWEPQRRLARVNIGYPLYQYYECVSFCSAYCDLGGNPEEGWLEYTNRLPVVYQYYEGVLVCSEYYDLLRLLARVYYTIYYDCWLEYIIQATCYTRP